MTDAQKIEQDNENVGELDFSWGSDSDDSGCESSSESPDEEEKYEIGYTGSESNQSTNTFLSSNVGDYCGDWCWVSNKIKLLYLTLKTGMMLMIQLICRRSPI